MMAPVVTVSLHLDSRELPGNQTDQLSREKRDGGVVTAALIGGVVTIASAAARAPPKSPGKLGGCEWKGNGPFCSPYCERGYEQTQKDNPKDFVGLPHCLTGQLIQCCKRNRDTNGHTWAGDWASTTGYNFNCKVVYAKPGIGRGRKYRSRVPYDTCEGQLHCIEEITNKRVYWSIGTIVNGKKDCGILQARYLADDDEDWQFNWETEGEAYTGKIVWNGGYEAGEVWYKV